MHLALCFPDLTHASPLAAIVASATSAAASAARADIRRLGLAAIQPLDDAARDGLEEWLGAYAHDEQLLAALAPADRAGVLRAAWESYRAVVLAAGEAA